MRFITTFCLLSAVCAVALGQWGGQLRRFGEGFVGQMLGGNGNGGSQPGGSFPNPLEGITRQFSSMLNPSGNGAQGQPGASQQGQTQGQLRRLGEGFAGQMMDGIRNGASQLGGSVQNPLEGMTRQFSSMFNPSGNGAQGQPGQEQGRLGGDFLGQMSNMVNRVSQQGDGSGENPLEGMMGQFADRLSSSGIGGQRLPWGSQQGEAQGLGGGLPGQMGNMLNRVNDQLQSLPWSSWIPQTNNIRNQLQRPGQQQQQQQQRPQQQQGPQLPQQQQQLSQQQPGVDNNANAQR